jgi:holo-[acyl-carrier protein] synthase
MHIVGIGTEIVECVRIGRMIERHGEAFLTRVYTAREIQCCRSKKHVTEHFAGRWAAKQAVLKSLGVSRRQGLAWTDIEVRIVREVGPKVFLCGLAKERALAVGVSDIALSIGHCRAYATATAIALVVKKP